MRSPRAGKAWRQARSTEARARRSARAWQCGTAGLIGCRGRLPGPPVLDHPRHRQRNAEASAKAQDESQEESPGPGCPGPSEDRGKDDACGGDTGQRRARRHSRSSNRVHIGLPVYAALRPREPGSFCLVSPAPGHVTRAVTATGWPGAFDAVIHRPRSPTVTRDPTVARHCSVASLTGSVNCSWRTRTKPARSNALRHADRLSRVMATPTCSGHP
jgi:hypothetical protein